MESIYGNAPDEIKEIYKKILWSLLMKLNVPNEEASNIMGEIGGHGMGYLFENMDKMNIQAERRNTAREKQRADTAEEQVSNERKEKKHLNQKMQLSKENAVWLSEKQDSKTVFLCCKYAFSLLKKKAYRIINIIELRACKT